MKIKPRLFWFKEFDCKDFDYDKALAMRDEAFHQLEKGIPKDQIELFIETKVVHK